MLDIFPLCCYPILMSKTFVYIDESGDIGLTNRSKPFFVMIAVITNEQNSHKIKFVLDQIKKELKWRAGTEFKFSKTKKPIIERVLQAVSNENFIFYQIVYEKESGIVRIKGQSVYNTLLLELIRKTKRKHLNIIVDGGFGRKHQRNTKTFLRKSLPEGTIDSFSYADSKSDNLLQLADLVAGALMRFLSGKSSTEKHFYQIIKHKNKSS